MNVDRPPTPEEFTEFSATEGAWSGPGLVIDAAYHQFYVLRSDDPRVDWAFDRLVEVDAYGDIVITTVCAMGPVAVRADVRSSPPPEPAPEWDQVEEVTIPGLGDLLVQSWGGGAQFPIPMQPGEDHRLRVHRSTWEAQYDSSERQVHEYYLLQIWPVPATTTTDAARDRIASDEVLRAQEIERKRAEQKRTWDEQTRRAVWGGGEPSPTLEAIGGQASTVYRADWMLAEMIASSRPQFQRDLAAWAVGVAFESVDLSGLDLELALDRIRRGEPLPPEFDYPALVGRFFGESTSTLVTTVWISEQSTWSEPAQPVIAPAAAALAALSEANRPDQPGAAAMGALAQTAAGQNNRDAFWTRVRGFWTVPPTG